MTVTKIKSIGDVPYPIDVGSDALSPLLTAGAALGITGNDAEESAWLTRTSEADGVASVRSIHGRTLRWNQLVQNGNFADTTIWNTNHCSMSASGNVATIAPSGTYARIYQDGISITSGHKYLLTAEIKKTAAAQVSAIYVSESGLGAGSELTSPTTDPLNVWLKFAAIKTASASNANSKVYVCDSQNYSTEEALATRYVRNVMVIDLTAMFGAGSEPSTIEEFTALYPLSYYAYDAGSLLPVSMTGIETTGFNQWDGTFKSGNQHFDYTTGEFNSAGGWVCTDKIPAFPDTVYYLRADLASGSTSSIVVGCWDAGDNYLGHIRYGTWNSMTSAAKPNTAYIRAEWTNPSTVTNVCINLSWSGRRNGEYEPYWSSQRLIDVATYFPDGMRSAGSVYDELTSTEAITRVGVVAINDVSWTMASAGVFYLDESQLPNLRTNNSGICLSCEVYTPISAVSGAGAMLESAPDMSVSVSSTSNVRLYVKDTRYSTQAEFNAATTDALIYYALATPTTTPIDPALNLTYRTAAGGTERVLVPTGENSAPPTLITAQGYTAESLRDAALSAIAPVENGLASTNYGVGSYLVHGGQLCRVTVAIATGETITIGTNVTATTVMAEILSLVQ